MNTFLTKLEVAGILANQYDVPQEIKSKVAQKTARLSEPYFTAMTVRAGITIQNFGYNRYFIK